MWDRGTCGNPRPRLQPRRFRTQRPLSVRRQFLGKRITFDRHRIDPCTKGPSRRSRSTQPCSFRLHRLDYNTDWPLSIHQCDPGIRVAVSGLSAILEPQHSAPLRRVDRTSPGLHASIGCCRRSTGCDRRDGAIHCPGRSMWSRPAGDTGMMPSLHRR